MYTYLAAQAAHTCLSHDTEELWLAWVLVAQIADSRLTVHTHKAWVRCR